MKTKKHLQGLLTVLIALALCLSISANTLAVAATLSVSPREISAPAGGSTYTVTVTSNSTWKVAFDVSWLTVDKSTGSGNGSFKVTVKANTSTTSARNAPISVQTTASSGNVYTYVTINQAKATPPALTKPTITYPTSTSVINPGESVTIRWNYVANATYYDVAVRDTTTGQLIKSEDTVGNVNSYTLSGSYMVANHSYNIWVEANAPNYSPAGTNQAFSVTTPITYIIRYDANGGAGAPASQTKTHGVALTLSSTRPTWSGHTFLGWSTSSTATTAAYQPGGSYTINASNILYAVWQVTPTLTIDTTSISAPASGGTYTVNVSSNTTWSVTCTNTNVTSLSKTSGSGNGSFTVTVKANTTASTRSDAISVFNSSSNIYRSISVFQAAVSKPNPPAAPTFTSVTSNSITVNWAAVTGATDYEVYKYVNGKTTCVKGTTNGERTYKDDAVSPNTEYQYSIKAKNSGGTSEQGAWASKTSLPGIPSGLRVTGFTCNSVSLAWNAPAGEAPQYEVYRGTTLAKTVNTTSCTVEGLTGNTEYGFYVRAKNASGTSPGSDGAFQLTLHNPPAAPTFTNVTYNSVTVNWAVVSGSTGYELWRATTSENKRVATPAGTATSYTDPTVAANTTYSYYLKVNNRAGTSDSGTARAVTTPPPPAKPNPPGAPTFSDIKSTSVQISWNPVAGADDYEVWTFYGITKCVTSSTDGATTYPSSNLSANAKYDYYIIAKNKSGSSEPGTSSSVTTLPGIPANLRVTDKTNHSVSLAWNTPEGGAPQYEVYMGTTLYDTVNTTSCTVQKLTENTSYGFYVKAKNASGTSPGSSAVTQRTLHNPPAAPTFTNVTSDSVTVNWAGVPGATGYELWRATGMGTYSRIASPASGDTSYPDTGLSANTTYSYYLKVKNEAGSSDSGTAASVTTPPPTLDVLLDDVGLFTINDDPDGIVAAINPIALVRNTSGNKVAEVANINIPLGLECNWEFKGTTTNGSIILNNNNRDISVSTPSSAGKYTLEMTFYLRGVKLPNDIITRTVYVTFGNPELTYIGNGVNIYWLEAFVSGHVSQTLATNSQLQFLRNLTERINFTVSWNGGTQDRRKNEDYLNTTSNKTVFDYSCRSHAIILSRLAKMVGIGAGTTDDGSGHRWSYCVLDEKEYSFDSVMNSWGEGSLEGGRWAAGSIYFEGHDDQEDTKNSLITKVEYKLGFETQSISADGGTIDIVGLNGYNDIASMRYGSDFLNVSNISNGSCTITVEPNTRSGTPRIGFLVATKDADKKLIIVMQGVPISYPISSTGAEVNIGTWDGAFSSEPYIHVLGGGSQIMASNESNSNDIIIQVDPNTSSQSRTGTIIVANGDETETIYINQDGTNATIKPSTTNISLLVSGGENKVNVTSNVSWEVSADADWLDIFPSSGFGDGEFTIYSDENTFTSPRTATTTISGGGVSKTITVQQEGLNQGYGSNGKFLAPIEVPDPNAIKIYTAEDLDNVRNNLSGSYVLMNDIDLAGWGNDQWEPIGDNSTTSNRFIGTFDGQGYVIKGLRIRGDTYQYVGLFGFLDGATIKNLGLEDIAINVSYSLALLVGGIFGGNSRACSIHNCYNTGDISATSLATRSRAGGICGSAQSSIISYCYNTGDISSVSSNSSDTQAGGICGLSTYNTVSNCYNTGDVYASDDIQAHAGGICGNNNQSSSITNCYNIGEISASSPHAQAGGICGPNYGSVSNCHNAGDVFYYYSPAVIYSYVGGICGYTPLPGDNIVGYISNCVVLSGNIYAKSGTSPVSIHSYLIGYGGIKTNNLALEDIAGNPTNDADDLITLSQAREQATYEELGWNFENVWQMVPGYDYPQFKVMQDISKPDGSVTMETNAKEVRVGEEYSYLITLKNSAMATEAWKNVVATDVLPDELDYVSFEIISGGSTYSDVEVFGQTITMNCGDIKIGGEVVVEIRVHVNPYAAAKVGERIVNTVIAKSDNDNDKESTDKTPLIKGSSGGKPLYVKEATGNIGTIGRVVFEIPDDEGFLDKYALVCDEDIDVEIYYSPKRTENAIAAGQNTYIFAVRLPNGETSEDISFSFKPVGGEIEKNKIIIYGDVNEDGYITTTDATLVTRWAGGNTATVIRNILAADVNGDAYITTTDATLVTRRAGGSPVVFSIETRF